MEKALTMICGELHNWFATEFITGTITIAPNTKTLLSGNLFTGTRSFISLNSAWNADIEENF